MKIFLSEYHSLNKLEMIRPELSVLKLLETLRIIQLKFLQRLMLHQMKPLPNKMLTTLLQWSSMKSNFKITWTDLVWPKMENLSSLSTDWSHSKNYISSSKREVKTISAEHQWSISKLIYEWNGCVLFENKIIINKLSSILFKKHINN